MSPLHDHEHDHDLESEYDHDLYHDKDHDLDFDLIVPVYRIECFMRRPSMTMT